MSVEQRKENFRDKCGVVGVFGQKESAHICYLAMHSLQHRGQDSAGIAVNDNGLYRRQVGMGLVADIFDNKKLAFLKGTIALGHVRYCTAGGISLSECQPLAAKTAKGHMSIAHNGNITNADFLRRQLEKEGAIFHTTSDTEVICHLFAKSPTDNIIDSLRQTMEKLRGGFSLCMMIDDNLIGIRDNLGFRPLFLARRKDGYVLASEDCGFSLIEAQVEREIAPGEMIVINKSGVKSYDLIGKGQNSCRPCIFEQVYFARPDSHVFGQSVYQSRINMGKSLARVLPVPADVVIAVPDSGVLAAMGYSRASGIPFDMGLVRNHYVGRTFIEPESKIRHFGVKLKLNAVKEVVEDRSLIVVDDSIVRGTTSKKIVSILREAGAKKIHFRVSAPETRFPCRYGIATPTKEELIASHKNCQEIQTYLNVDSLAYLPTHMMHESVGTKRSWCDACFTGQYPQ